MATKIDDGPSVLELHMAAVLERLAQELTDDAATRPAVITTTTGPFLEAPIADGVDVITTVTSSPVVEAPEADGAAVITTAPASPVMEMPEPDGAADTTTATTRPVVEAPEPDGAADTTTARTSLVVEVPEADRAATGPVVEAPETDRAPAPTTATTEPPVAPVAGGATDATQLPGRSSARSSTPADAVDELLGILGAVAALGDTEWHELNGNRVHQALDVLEQLDRRLAGLRSGVLSTIEANSLWALEGQRTFNAWLRQRTDATPSAASRQVRHARALRDHLPLTREALEAGTISAEHVAILVREALTTHRLRAQLTDADLGEAFLVEQARAMDAGTFTKLVKSWAIAADPQAADRAWRDAGTKEQLTLSQTLDGYHLAGWLDKVSGETVAAALRAHMGRKSKDDDCTPAQRRAAALTSLARQSLDAGLQGAHSRIRPHLTVTTSFQTLRALAAATGSPALPRCSDGTPHTPGAAFGFYADSAFAAPGGPRDPDRPKAPFELSPEARRWYESWKPGDDHVISAAIDPQGHDRPRARHARGRHPDPTRAAGPPRVRLRALPRHLRARVHDSGRGPRAADLPGQHGQGDHRPGPAVSSPRLRRTTGFGEIHHSLHWYLDHGPPASSTGSSSAGTTTTGSTPTESRSSVPRAGGTSTTATATSSPVGTPPTNRPRPTRGQVCPAARAASRSAPSSSTCATRTPSAAVSLHLLRGDWP